MTKIMKSDRRSSLHTGTLSDLLEIQVEGPPLAFLPDRAVKLWRDDCKTTPKLLEKNADQGPQVGQSHHHASCTPSSSEIEASSDSTEEALSLDNDNWDNFFDYHHQCQSCT